MKIEVLYERQKLSDAFSVSKQRIHLEQYAEIPTDIYATTQMHINKLCKELEAFSITAIIDVQFYIFHDGIKVSKGQNAYLKELRNFDGKNILAAPIVIK